MIEKILSNEQLQRVEEILADDSYKLLDPNDLELLSVYMLEQNEPDKAEVIQRAIINGFYGKKVE